MFGSIILITWMIAIGWIIHELINAPIMDENERVIKKD